MAESLEFDGQTEKLKPPFKYNRYTGTVKWFNVKEGYGFITRHDTNEDIFVHSSAIYRKNPRHMIKSVGEGEVVEFSLVASKITGPNFKPVKGSPFVATQFRRRPDIGVS